MPKKRVKKNNKNNKKVINKNLIFTIIIAILFVWIFFIFSKQEKISEIEKENLEFIAALPQLEWKNLNKRACFDFSPNPTTSYIDCFIPNKFNTYVKWVEDLDTLKRALTSSYLVEELNEWTNLWKFENFFNSIQPTINWDENINYLPTRKKIEEKIKNNNYDNFDLENYTYIQSLEWNYKEAEKYRNLLCEKFPSNCKQKIELTITWQIVDWTGNWLEWANVEVLWSTSKIKTKKEGFFEIKTETYNHEKVRISAIKNGYANGVIPMTIMSNNKEQSKIVKITLEKAEKYVTINTVNNTISWDWAKIEGKNYIITTDWSTYKIPFGAIINRDWKQFNWELKAYLFEFNKSSNNADLLNNDIFDNVAGYAWNLMKTFWMPYILFVSNDWEVLHILKSNPMLLQNKIQEMDALKTNQDKIYTELKDEDLEFLVKKSEELWEYPIDRFFLVKYNILRFPAFWVFDQTKWVWVNEWVKLLKTDWTIEIKFYTLSSL